MRQQRRRRRKCPRQYALGYEHRFVRKPNYPNRSFAFATPAPTIFVVYVTISSKDDEELEAFNMDLEWLRREDFTTFSKVVVGDFNT
ncbi:unnamed protein product [Haemonchus placei]|uniref:Endo/exonuclease/phosphatase domain-containing protein n=1 Tax=Haemonchus placei TaxID=6290 RepID=A0A0N4WFS8_HAEPC|nr:unnamed protein product [Haemonchus placei]